MNKKYISDDILLIENFLTVEEAESTKNLFIELNEKLNNKFWQAISFYESYSAGFPEKTDPLFKKYNLPEDWFEKIEKGFKESVAEVAKKDSSDIHKISFHSQKWEPGAFAPYHSDNSDNDGKLGAFERSRYAAFLYLNDDYEGGEISFKVNYGEFDYEIRPKTGTLIAFHGGHKNMHKVNVVKSNVRYTMGSFWDDRSEDSYDEEIREKWSKELKEIRDKQKIEQEEWKTIDESGLRMSPEGQRYKKEEVYSLKEKS